MEKDKLLQEIAVSRLALAGINPASIEVMVDLVKEPDGMQIVSMDLFKTREENKALKDRLKVLSRLAAELKNSLDKANERVKVLESLDNNTTKQALEYVNNLKSYMEGIVYLDVTSSDFIEDFKGVQNIASWILSTQSFINNSNKGEM